MAISIKNLDVEQAIRQLAREMGVDLTEAVEIAVKHELARTSHDTEARLARMQAIVDRVAALPILDNRSNEEILGYDEQGLPS